MRKTVSGLLLALLLAVVILPGRVSAAGNGFSGGTGTAEDPYQIATAEDLAAMSSRGASACYLQTADIDLSGTDDWKQITLSGTYDGGGYRILNFTSSTGGLFGTNSGTIRNVTMEGAKVSGNGLSNVGGLANIKRGNCGELCVFRQCRRILRQRGRYEFGRYRGRQHGQDHPLCCKGRLYHNHDRTKRRG